MKTWNCFWCSYHQNSHNWLNEVDLCTIKVSHDLNMNTPVPGRPQNLLENIPKPAASWRPMRFQNNSRTEVWLLMCFLLCVFTVNQRLSAVIFSRASFIKDYVLAQIISKESPKNNSRVLSICTLSGIELVVFEWLSEESPSISYRLYLVLY